MHFESARRSLSLGVLAIALLALPLAASLRLVSLSAALTHAPYVQDVTPTSVAILWDTDQPSTGRVELGPTGGQAADGAPIGQHHEIVLTGLASGTRYRYRVVVDGGATSEWSSVVTAPAGQVPFSFAVIGDAGIGSPEQTAIGQLLDRLDPDFVLMAGDVVYPAGAAADYLPHFFQPYQRLIGRLPFYPSLGNHDYGTDQAQPYLNAFRLPSGTSGTERYYSFDYAGAHFAALDSNQDVSPASPQYRWLAADLARSTSFWKFAFFHHPPFSSSRHGSSLSLREALAPLFERFGVDVVFSGHDHDYERTVPLRLSGPTGRAVTYVVTGGGGAPLYPAGRSDFTAVAQSVHHAVRMLVDGPRLTLEAVDATGVVFDRWTLDRSADVAARPYRLYLPLVEH